MPLSHVWVSGCILKAMSAAIDCQNLSKRYGRTGPFALKNLTLQVQPGETYGFLGPNGAGKSTTIRTLLNFLQPTAGRASIMGLDVVNNSVKVKKHVGYLAGEIALYPRMTGRQFLDYMSAIQPLKNRQTLNNLVQQFDAELDKPIQTLSKGNRQKIGLIQAFMHEPEVLILDEPTSGLDPLMQAAFYDLVETVTRGGAAVFLSSHDLAEVRKMCDRIGFVKNGELITEKTLADLQASAAHSFDVTFKAEAPLGRLQQLPGTAVTRLNSHAVTIKIQGKLKPLLKILADSEVVALDKHEVSLEEEFLRLYEKDEVKAQ
jgi:ABC-2 type transport system ATP-binding protein